MRIVGNVSDLLHCVPAQQHILLGSHLFVSEEIKDTTARNGKPKRSGSAENDLVGLTWIGALSGCDSNSVLVRTGQRCPPVRGGCAHVLAEDAHHPLHQFHHAPPPLGRGYYSELSCRDVGDHETGQPLAHSLKSGHRSASNAISLLSKCLYIRCTPRSTGYTCSTHVTLE